MTTPASWPQAREYRDAVQSPKVCFASSKLKAAVIHPDLMGMPLAATGKSAIVFKATAGGKDVAIRCFTRASSSQRLRYQELQKHLKSTFPSYMVKFKYRDEEILVAGARYPLVEMDWVDGNPLDVWVEKHLHDGNLAGQAGSWLAITGDMQRRGMAHGDIANDNCMVSGSELKLVDYDGCYIQELAGKNPGEAGAQHFQHPGRKGYYAANMDAFPSLVIYLSLLALQADPSLWRFHKDKNLIFQAADYRAPRATPVWQELARSPDRRVVSLTSELAVMCGQAISDLRPLPEVVTPWWTDSVSSTGPVRISPPPATPSVKNGNGSTAGPSPDWLRDYVPDGGQPQPTEPAYPLDPELVPAVRPEPAPPAPRPAPPPRPVPAPRPAPVPTRWPQTTLKVLVMIAIIIAIWFFFFHHGGS